MRRIFSVLILILAPAGAFAQQTQPVVVAAAPPFFVTLVVFLAAAACVVFCFQVFSLVRGGQLSKIWLLFTTGFCVLAISQLLVILSGFGLVSNTPYLVPVLLIAMAGLFFYGLWEAKRVLG